MKLSRTRLMRVSDEEFVDLNYPKSCGFGMTNTEGYFQWIDKRRVKRQRRKHRRTA